MDDHAHCLDVLRMHDRDRYLSSLLCPEKYRDDCVALYAFNAEIARVRDVVSEPMPGEIRLQWWRDAIANDDKGARANPLANALSEVIVKHNLPRDAFDKMLLARAFDLYDDPMPSMGDFEGYAGETTSLLFQLSALIAGAEPSSQLAQCCGHAGVSYALITILRDLPRHASRGQLYLPADILKESGAQPTLILGGDMHEGLSKALIKMIALCRDHRQKATASLGELPSSLRPVFLPLCLIEPHLRKMEKAGFNPFADRMKISQLRAQWVLWRGR